jgi:hypothetical protein
MGPPHFNASRYAFMVETARPLARQIVTPASAAFCTAARDGEPAGRSE